MKYNFTIVEIPIARPYLSETGLEIIGFRRKIQRQKGWQG